MSRPLSDRFREFMELGESFDEKIKVAKANAADEWEEAGKLIFLKYKDLGDKYPLEPCVSSFHEQLRFTIFEVQHTLRKQLDSSYRWTLLGDHSRFGQRDEDNRLRLDMLADMARLLGLKVPKGTLFDE